MEKSMPSPIQRMVLQLYDEVDREVSAAGPVCIASGRCCRFHEFGHTLFLSNLEADVLLTLAPDFNRPTSKAFCPFQKDNLCTAREPRPLACRIYYCDPSFKDRMEHLSEKYLLRIKEIADQLGMPWKYAPLHDFLNEPGP
jgi:Fe-S-cluster containining protein